MRILFLAPRHPYPPRRGDQVRAYGLIKALARRAAVRVVCFGEGEELPVDGVSVRSVGRGVAGAVIANLSRPDPRIPGQVRMYLNRSMRRAVAEELASSQADVVHATLARMAPYLPPGRKAGGAAHTHLDLVDSLARNMRTRSEAAGLPLGLPFALEARLMAGYEARAVATADTCSLVTEEDKVGALGLERATVVPLGVDRQAIPYREPAERPAELLFFGNLGYFHNVGPAEFVAREVLPRVRRSAPEATLRIAGARPTAAVRRLANLEGVEVAADVPDMAAELHRAAVAVLPMFSGSGLKNKVLEAFSAGTPVVTNAPALAGLPDAGDGACLVAATADEMAAAAVRLLENPAQRVALARHGSELVDRFHGWDAQAERLLALYEAH